jgi:hypothetical protein
VGALLTFGTIFWVGRENVRTGGDDFLALYAGARLVGSGHMYDPAAVRLTQLRAAGFTTPSLLYTRPPCFALFLWPLAQLPYRLAHGLWLGLLLAAAIAFVALWPHANRASTAMVCCWSVPLAAGLANGQDALLLLLWLALSERLYRSGKPALSGAVLALCVAKFHLFLLLPLVFLIHRRWGVLAGGAAGCGLLAVFCWLAGGWDWPVRYFRVLSLSQINPARGLMPNIHGLFPGGPVEWLATFAVVLATLLAVSRLQYPLALAAALTGSLLVSYHAYPQDALILIPAILIALENGRSLLLRYAALALATPVPWLLLLSRQG